jgi:hypothetical protein
VKIKVYSDPGIRIQLPIPYSGPLNHISEANMVFPDICQKDIVPEPTSEQLATSKGWMVRD